MDSEGRAFGVEEYQRGFLAGQGAAGADFRDAVQRVKEAEKELNLFRKQACDREDEKQAIEAELKALKAEGGARALPNQKQLEVFAAVEREFLDSVGDDVPSAYMGEQGPEREAIAEVFLQQLDKALRKNAAYGGSVFRAGPLTPNLSPDNAILVRMGDKIGRLGTLIGKGADEADDESVEDTMGDLGVYAFLWLACRELKRAETWPDPKPGEALQQVKDFVRQMREGADNPVDPAVPGADRSEAYVRAMRAGHQAGKTEMVEEYVRKTFPVDPDAHGSA